MGKVAMKLTTQRKKKYWNTYFVQIAKIINIFRFIIDFFYMILCQY